MNDPRVPKQYYIILMQRILVNLVIEALADLLETYLYHFMQIDIVIFY